MQSLSALDVVERGLAPSKPVWGKTVELKII